MHFCIMIHDSSSKDILESGLLMVVVRDAVNSQGLFSDSQSKRLHDLHASIRHVFKLGFLGPA